MNENTKDLLTKETDKTDVSKAIELMKTKKDKTRSKTEASQKPTVKDVRSYKENEIAVAINTFLSKNLDEESGTYLVGENTARTLEHYGIKSHPIIGLLVAVAMVAVHFFTKLMKPKEPGENKPLGTSRQDI